MTDSHASCPKTKSVGTGKSGHSSCFTIRQLDYYLYGKKTVLPVAVNDLGQTLFSLERKRQTAFSEASDICLGKKENKTTHGPLQSLRQLVHAKDQGKAYDELQPTYAVSSFPDEVHMCTSSIPGTEYGVCTKQLLPSGAWIGPYEGQRTVDQRSTHKEDYKYMWEIYEGGEFSHFINGSDERSSSWMRFICCARNEYEQNMAAFQYGQNIYYRCTRDIPVGEELLVWYSDSYLKHLEIPLVLKETDQVKIDEVTKPWNDCRLSSVPPLAPRSKLYSARRATTELPSSGFCEHLPETHEPKSRKSTVGYSPESFKPVAPTFQQTLANQIRERRERLKGRSDGPKANDKQELSEYSPRELTKLHFGETAYEERYSESSHFEFGLQEDSELQTAVFNDSSSPFKCKQCLKIFTQRIQLQMHVCPKAPYKPFQCGHCSLSFAQPSELRNHVVVHTSERPFKCGFCGRSFAGATTLNNHVRTHTGEKPFNCSKCGKTFSIATQLSRHARVPGECVEYTKSSQTKFFDSLLGNQQM